MAEKTLESLIKELANPFEKSGQKIKQSMAKMKQEQWFGNVIDNIVEEIERIYEEWRSKTEGSGAFTGFLGTLLPMVLGPWGSVLGGVIGYAKDEDVRNKYEEELLAIKERTDGTFLEDYSSQAHDTIASDELKDSLITKNLFGTIQGLAVPKIFEFGQGMFQKGFGETALGSFIDEETFSKMLEETDVTPTLHGLTMDEFIAEQAKSAAAGFGPGYVPEIVSHLPSQISGEGEDVEIIPGRAGVYTTHPAEYEEVISQKKIGQDIDYAFENWAELSPDAQSQLKKQGITPLQYEKDLLMLNEMKLFQPEGDYGYQNMMDYYGEEADWANRRELASGYQGQVLEDLSERGFDLKGSQLWEQQQKFGDPILEDVYGQKKIKDEWIETLIDPVAPVMGPEVGTFAGFASGPGSARFIPWEEQVAPTLDIAGGIFDKIGGVGSVLEGWFPALEAPIDFAGKAGPWMKGLGGIATPYWAPYLMGGQGYGYAPQLIPGQRPVNPALLSRYRS